MKFFELFQLFAAVLLIVQLAIVSSEEVYFNGTHRLPQNITKVEVTTVKIAEIVSFQGNSTKKTIVLRQKTAKHFVTSTPNSKVVLIPPAMIGSQIVEKNNVHKS